LIDCFEEAKIFVHGMRRIHGYKPMLRYGNRINHLPLNIFYEVREEGSFELGRNATQNRTPSKIKITPEFAKLVGYFISDGHYTNKDIRITVGLEETEREILDILRRLKLPFSILNAEGKAKQIVIGSRLLRLVFKHVLEIPEGAKNKRLPKVFLQLPSDLKIALLSGLFNGNVIVKKDTTIEEVNAAFAKAEEGHMKGFIAVDYDKRVSSDFIGCETSAIVAEDLTQVMDGNMVKVMAWYDNEWGYSCRLIDMAAHISKEG